MPSNTQAIARHSSTPDRYSIMSAASTSTPLPKVRMWLNETPRSTACDSDSASAPDWLISPMAWAPGSQAGGNCWNDCTAPQP